MKSFNKFIMLTGYTILKLLKVSLFDYDELINLGTQDVQSIIRMISIDTN